MVSTSGVEVAGFEALGDDLVVVGLGNDTLVIERDQDVEPVR